MKRCKVCREKVYREFGEHVRMHQLAEARRKVLKRTRRTASEVREPLGIGAEIRPLQPQGKPGFWSGLGSFFRNLKQWFVWD